MSKSKPYIGNLLYDLKVYYNRESETFRVIDEYNKTDLDVKAISIEEAVSKLLRDHFACDDVDSTREDIELAKLTWCEDHQIYGVHSRQTDVLAISKCPDEAFRKYALLRSKK